MENIYLEKEQSISMLYMMILIRTFENAVSNYKMQGQIYGMAHCYNGQEAIAVGACSALNISDYIISNHRPHGHAIAKGIEPKYLMAEIFGRSTGTNAGKGGSMHVNDIKHGLITSTGIVGSGIPVACGAAFASKYQKDRKVTCVFFGDGSTNEGVLHECLNLAAVWELPIVFMLEDNGLAVTTLAKNTSACSDYTALASVYGINSISIDGQNVEAVYSAVRDAAQIARDNSKPTFIQAKTIRFNEHAEGEYYLRMRDTNYRDNDEIARAKNTRCPIKLYSDVLCARGAILAADIDKLYKKANEEIQSCIDFAMKSPNPDPKTAYQNVYKEGSVK